MCGCKRGLLRVTIVCLTLLLWAQAAWAADVVMGERVVFRLENEKQAAVVSERLENLLQDGAKAQYVEVKVTEVPDPKDATKKKKNKVASIFWQNILIVTITPEMAKANASVSSDLADKWASNIRAVVAIGLLNLDVSKTVVGVGAEKLVVASGLAVGELTATDSTGRVEVEVDEAKGIITLRGKSIGKTQVRVRKGKGEQTVAVHVKDWAGKLPSGVSVQVTGRPALAAAVGQAALLAIATDTVVRPGCAVYIDESGFNPKALPSGDHMRINVPVGIAPGEDYFAVRGEVPVAVENVGLDSVESNLLLVSNRPERVSQDGILLNYTFTKKEPTRLMYSHLNDSTQRRNLWVNVANNNDTPVKLVVNWTYAGPERSEVHVGQSSARRFLESEAAQSGFVLNLPEHSAYELAAHDMKNKALVSGFATFRILEGDSATVEVRTALAPSNNDGSSLPYLGAPFNPFKIHPHGVFAQPFFEYEGEYLVGGNPVVFRYGESPWLIDFETGLPNTGNFGVLYKAMVELKNDSDASRDVGLYFTPLSGPGGGTFIVDNRILQAPFRQIHRECLVDTISLPAHSSKMVEVVTFPEASSCYPAQFEFREVSEN